MGKGRIVDITKKTYFSCDEKQGIKASEQKKYDNDQRYAGSNGTYTYNHRSENSYNMKVVVYEDEHGPQRTVNIDITDFIKNENPDWKRISPQRLEAITNQIKGKKIDLAIRGDSLGFNTKILHVEEPNK